LTLGIGFLLGSETGDGRADNPGEAISGLDFHHMTTFALDWPCAGGEEKGRVWHFVTHPKLLRALSPALYPHLRRVTFQHKLKQSLEKSLRLGKG
jgi:hypothetical protein